MLEKLEYYRLRSTLSKDKKDTRNIYRKTYEMSYSIQTVSFNQIAASFK